MLQLMHTMQKPLTSSGLCLYVGTAITFAADKVSNIAVSNNKLHYDLYKSERLFNQRMHFFNEQAVKIKT